MSQKLRTQKAFALLLAFLIIFADILHIFPIKSETTDTLAEAAPPLITVAPEQSPLATPTPFTGAFPSLPAVEATPDNSIPETVVPPVSPTHSAPDNEATEEISNEETLPVQSPTLPSSSITPPVEELLTTPTSEPSFESSPPEATVPDAFPSENQTSLPLAQNAIIAYTYDELSQALSQDNGITLVYLSGNISQGTSDREIVIHPSKTSLVISGLAPASETISVFNQSSDSSAIKISSTTLQSITIEKMTIRSQGSHPFILIDEALGKSPSIILSEVRYTGPQVTNADDSKVRLNSSTITIIAADADETPAPSDEISEGETPSPSVDSGEETSAEPTGDTLDSPSPSSSPTPSASQEIPQISGLISSRAITILDSQSVIVYTYDELVSVLNYYNDYNYIYLGADITQLSSSPDIFVHSSKTSLVIDGLAPGATVPATFTQYYAATPTRGIYIGPANTTIQNVTLRNMHIEGYNYYGVIGVAESVYVHPDLIYENITYNGPQITYAVYSSAHYHNCNITIKQQGTAANEVAEATHVSFSGTVNISVIGSIGTSLFWMRRGNGTFTLNPGANVTISGPNYLMYTDTVASTTILLEEGSSLNYTGGYQGFQYDAQILKQVTLKSGATMNLEQTSNYYAYGMLRIQESLILEPGASLLINKGTGGFALQFTAAGSSVTFNDPERVMLYAPSRQLFSFVGATTLNIAADAVNLWATSSFAPASISNTPNYIWNKKPTETLTISSSFSGNTQQGITHNLSPGDPTQNLTTSTFAVSSVGSNQLLTCGRLDLQTDTITHLDKFITGTTETSAQLIAQYPTSGGSSTITGTTAGANFSLPVTENLIIGEAVTVKAFSNSLNKIEKSLVLEAILELAYVPPTISFENHIVPSEQILIPFSNPEDFFVIINDNRKNQSWTLLISAGVVTTSTGKILPASLVMIDDNGQRVISDTPIEIATGSGDSFVEWPEGQGIALLVDSGEVYSDIPYSATVRWILSDE